MDRVCCVAIVVLLGACGPGQVDELSRFCPKIEPLDQRASWPVDIDGDGHLDLLRATGGPLDSEDGAWDLQIAWGDGALGFVSAPGPVFETYPGLFATDFELADLDGDGRLDFVHHGFDPGEFDDESVMHVARQTAPREFGAPVEVEPEGLEAKVGLIAADLDGDGDDDLVACTLGESKLFTITSEAGALGPAIPGATVPRGCPRTVVDLDGDGREELITIDRPNLDDQVLVYVFGAGPDASLELRGAYPIGDGDRHNNHAVGDFNGDGHPDLVFASTRSLALVRGHGDGSLSLAAELEIPGYDGLAAEHCTTQCSLIWAVGAGDFDGDGAAELLVQLGNYDSPDPASWLIDDLPSGSPRFVAFASDGADLLGASVADLDEDGCDDLLYRRDRDQPESELVLRRCPLAPCD